VQESSRQGLNYRTHGGKSACRRKSRRSTEEASKARAGSQVPSLPEYFGKEKKVVCIVMFFRIPFIQLPTFVAVTDVGRTNEQSASGAGVLCISAVQARALPSLPFFVTASSSRYKYHKDKGPGTIFSTRSSLAAHIAMAFQASISLVNSSWDAPTRRRPDVLPIQSLICALIRNQAHRFSSQ
jgi:hypothetical protein